MGDPVMEAHQLSDNIITAPDQDRWNQVAKHTTTCDLIYAVKATQII